MQRLVENTVSLLPFISADLNGAGLNRFFKKKSSGHHFEETKCYKVVTTLTLVSVVNSTRRD